MITSYHQHPFITMKDYAKGFYNRKWLPCRDAYRAHRVSVDGGMCERCHNALGYIVHHKTELTAENISDPEIALNFDNLEYVCLECHNRIHGVGTNKNRVCFDAEGNVFEIPENIF